VAWGFSSVATPSPEESLEESLKYWETRADVGNLDRREAAYDISKALMGVGTTYGFDSREYRKALMTCRKFKARYSL